MKKIKKRTLTKTETRSVRGGTHDPGETGDISIRSKPEKLSANIKHTCACFA